MSTASPPSTHIAIALQVLVMAVCRLANWSNASTPFSDQEDLFNVKSVHTVLPWPDNTAHFSPLRLLFDQIQFGKNKRKSSNFWPIGEIEFNKIKGDENTHEYPNIPYPIQSHGSEDLTAYKKTLKQAIASLSPSDWENPTILSLFIEKYASFISLGDTATAFSDLVRIKGEYQQQSAVALAILAYGIADLDHLLDERCRRQKEDLVVASKHVDLTRKDRPNHQTPTGFLSVRAAIETAD